MARVAVIDPQTATGEAKQLLAAVQSGLCMVPNFIRVLANSPRRCVRFSGFTPSQAQAQASWTRKRASALRWPSPNRMPEYLGLFRR
ncbi:MAG: hypothetical protein U1D06_09285 [Paracoccaceae bacterium]|nr:hypothetical protein [Paracoccaceae bacterium]